MRAGASGVSWGQRRRCPPPTESEGVGPPLKVRRHKRLVVDEARPHGLGPVPFAILAVALGAIAGLGAWVFRALIALFHNLLLLGELSLHYDTNVHTAAGPWGPAIVLAPLIGAIGVVFLVEHFAPEARGHGVPEVMDAIYYKKGVIRPVVAAVKALASGLSIGSGGSVGREGPIIQIGAAVASWVGPDRAGLALADRHAGRRGRRRRHRRDLQHPDRRGPVRGRDPVARGQRADPGPGGPGDRDRDLRRPAPVRQPPGVRDPGPARDDLDPGGPLAGLPRRSAA